MKKINHPVHGECYELEAPNDIAFARMAKGSLVNKTVFPSGVETPAEDLIVRDKYLVKDEKEIAKMREKFGDHL